MLSSELIAQIKHLQIKAGRLVTDALAGEYSSAFRGMGMEFEKVREYVPGDDIRTIDWNVTARMNAPYVKIFREERELTLMLMVDVSASQVFGTEDKLKREVAAELAAILAFLAIKNNDKVGLVIFSDHVESYIPAKKGRSHVWRIIRTILSHETKGRGTDIKGALEHLTMSQKRKTTCFLISDFMAPDFGRELRIASRKHEMICAHVRDLRELEIPACGVIDMIDPESGKMVAVDTSNKSFMADRLRRRKQEQEQLEKSILRYKMDYFMVPTHEPVSVPLTQLIRKRERR